MRKMSSVIKYPDWQPDYLAAVMEADVALMAEKVFRAESAILNRREPLARGDGTDNAAELTTALGVSKTTVDRWLE